MLLDLKSVISDFGVRLVEPLAFVLPGKPDIARCWWRRTSTPAAIETVGNLFPVGSLSFTLTTQPSVTPNGLAIAPDGSKAYITGHSMNNSVVQVIDLKTRAVTETFPTTIPWAQSATLTPDGSQLWVNTDNLDSGVDVFDRLTNTLVTTLNIVDPTDIAFSSTGTVAYVTSSGTTPGTVYAINTATFQTITTYTVGPSPADIAMSYGDQFLVVNNGDGTVSVINLRQKKISSVKIGSTAVSGIAFVK